MHSMRAVAYLLITILLGVSYSSAQAQTVTPDLKFSTYLGGSKGYKDSDPLTFAQNVACDALGNIYVTGATQVSDLPVSTNAYQSTPAAGSTESAFVAKYNAAGQLQWLTYLGGNNQSMGIGVTATPAGGVAVVGVTTSSTFPTTTNAYQSQNNGKSDYFVTVFDAAGKLQYSTYLGGSGLEGAVTVQSGKIIFTDDSNNGNCVAVDANGRVYLGGITNSKGGSGETKFPVTEKTALQKDFTGSKDASLSILDPLKSGAAALIYSSFLGGDKDTQAHSVAVDPSGRYIALAGFTTSSTFPTTSNAYRSKAPKGGFTADSSNGFVTQFSSSQPGSSSSTYSMRYSTYLGGDSSTARDDVYGMTMTASGLIVATGRTQSANFPMTRTGPTIFNEAPYLKEGKSGDEPFVVKIDPAKSGHESLVYSTFLGGGSENGEWGSFATSVAVDARGAVYVAGETSAHGARYDPSNPEAPQTLPYTSNAYQNKRQGSFDAMLMGIAASGDSLAYSTFLGGSDSDRTYGLAVDPDGNVILAGLTFSSNFPVTPGGQPYPKNYGYQNAFVTKFSALYTSSNLIIDDGNTYTVSESITYDNNYSGRNGTGTQIQADFTNTVTNNLKLGQNAGASGAYTLSGGTLLVGNYAYVGYSGAGAFSQSGGTHTVTGILILGADAGGSGAYSLSGGSLTVGNYEAVGYFGAGSFTQSGGAHTVTALYLGSAAGASGSYTLSDSGSGSLLVVAGNEYVGYSGAGAFTQTGGSNSLSGALILAAASGSQGIYNLQGGVLAADSITVNRGGLFNQTGGAASGDLVNNGVFHYGDGIFNGKLANYGTVTISGNFSPLGGFEQAAAGALILTTGHTFTYNGASLRNPDSATIINDGTFIGAIDNHGYLGGSGVSMGSVTNHGTFNPGNSPGTYTISGGDYTNAAGALVVEIASAGAYDTVVVSQAGGIGGAATLSGTLAPSAYGGFQPLGNQVFPGVITAAAGVTGTFTGIAGQQFTPTLSWQARYNDTSVDLSVQRHYTNSALGLNSNQQAVGAMLNGVSGVASGDLNTVLNAIDYLPDTAGVQNVFKQISPEKAGALTSLGFAAATFQMRNLANRTANLRFVQGERRAGGSLAGGGLTCRYSRLDGLMLAYNGAFLPDLFSARQDFRVPESRWSLYLDGGAAFGSQNSTISQTGYRYTLGGMTLGADCRLRDNLLVGLATGYSNTSAGFDGSGGGVTAHTVPFNAYAAWFPGNLYAYGSLGYALNLYNLTRDLNFNGISRRASSSTTGNQLNLYVETGYDFNVHRFILTPSATLAYSGLWVGGFSESGAGALNLKIGPQSADSVQTGLGGRLTVPLRLGAAKIVPQGYAFFQHEFANGSQLLNASLAQGSNSFGWRTAAAGRNYALLGGSVTAGLSQNVYARINYSAEAGRSDSFAQSIYAGLGWQF